MNSRSCASLRPSRPAASTSNTNRHRRCVRYSNRVRVFTVTPLDDDVAELAILLEDLEPGPILAITWRAGLAADGPHRKALDLADIAKFLKLWPGPVVAVQRAPEPGEIARIEELAGRTVHDFCALLYRERPDCGWAHAWRELIADLAVDYELLAE